MFAAFKKPLEERCLDIANRLISKFKTSVPKIKSITDIDSNLIVLLFENVTKFNIPDLLCCTSKMEEAHNVQVVIDTLSLDLIGVSLSHINGEDVVAGNAVAINNLLEILEGMSLYLPLTDHDEGNQEHILKRKISRKRKSSVSHSKQVSNNITDSSNNVPVAKIMDKAADGSTSNLLNSAVPHHLTRIKKKRERRTSYREKYFTSEKPVDISTKLTKNLTKIRERRMPVHNKSDELDSNKILLNKKIKARMHLHLQNERKEDENKPYFYIEESTVNDNWNEQGSSKRKIKRKTAKLCRLNLKTQTENNVQPVKEKLEIEELYENNLEKKVRILLEKNSSHKSRSSHMKKVHLQAIKRPIQNPPVSACRKSFLLPHTLRRRSVTTTYKRISPRRTQYLQNTQKQNDKHLPENSKPGFIHELFEEFPGIQLTPQIVNHITIKYRQHLMKMYKQAKNRLLKKPKTQLQAEEAAKKQTTLNNILKKDILHEQHLKAFKERKKIENSIKYHLRDARLQSAKMKQYCDEFHTEMRKKMQKRNFTEELIFEKVFLDALKIQQDHVNRLCQEVKETGENDARKHLNYLEALENLYQSQFSLLSKSLTSEKRDAEDRIKAETELMNSMRREFREELKNEIRFMQRAIIECMEDTHFRELDAEQYTDKLRNRIS